MQVDNSDTAAQPVLSWPYAGPEEPADGDLGVAAAAAAVPPLGQMLGKAEVVELMRSALLEYVDSVSLCEVLPENVTFLCPPGNSELYTKPLSAAGRPEWLLHNIVRGGVDEADPKKWTEGCIRWTMRLDEVAGRYDETSITGIAEGHYVLDRRMRHEHGYPVKIDPRKIERAEDVGPIKVMVALLDSRDEFLRPTPAQHGITTFPSWYNKTAQSSAFTQVAPMVAEFLNDCNYDKQGEGCNLQLTQAVVPFRKDCSVSSIYLVEAYTTRTVEKGQELKWPYRLAQPSSDAPADNAEEQKLSGWLLGHFTDKAFADQRKLSIEEFVDSVPTVLQPRLKLILSDYMGPSGNINPVVHRQALWRLRCDADMGGGRMHVSFKTSDYAEQLGVVEQTESWLYPQLDVVSDTIALNDTTTPDALQSNTRHHHLNFMSAAKPQRGVFAKKNLDSGTRVAVMCGVPVNGVLLHVLVATCGLNAVVKSLPSVDAEEAVSAYFSRVLGPDTHLRFLGKLNTLLSQAPASTPSTSDDSFAEAKQWEEMIQIFEDSSFLDCIEQMANDTMLLLRDSTSNVQRSIMQMYNRVISAEDGFHQCILLPGGAISRLNMNRLQYLFYGIGDHVVAKEIEDAATWLGHTPKVWMQRGMQTHKTPKPDVLHSFYEQVVGLESPTDMLRNRLSVVRVTPEPLPVSQKIDFLQLASDMHAEASREGIDLHNMFVRQAGIVMMITASAEYSNTYQMFSTTIDEGTSASDQAAGCTAESRKRQRDDSRAHRSPQTVSGTLNAVFDALFVKRMREFQRQAFRWLLAAARVDLYERSYAVLISTFSAELADHFVITRLIEWTVQTESGAASQTLCVVSTDKDGRSDEILTKHNVLFVANPESKPHRLEDIVKLLSKRKGAKTTVPGMLPIVGHIVGDRRKGAFSTAPGALKRLVFERPADANDDTEVATAALRQYVFSLLKTYRTSAFLERKHHAAAVAVQRVVDKQLALSYDNIPLKQWSMSNLQLLQKFRNYKLWAEKYAVEVVSGKVVIKGPDAGRTTNLPTEHRQQWDWVAPPGQSASKANINSLLEKLVGWKLINTTKLVNSSTIRAIAANYLKHKALAAGDIEWLKIQIARNDYETSKDRFEQGRLRTEKIVVPTLPTSYDGRWQKAKAACLPWNLPEENALDAARGHSTSVSTPCRAPAASFLPDTSPAVNVGRAAKRPRKHATSGANSQATGDDPMQPPAFSPVDIGPLVPLPAMDPTDVLPAFDPTIDLNLLPAVDYGGDLGLLDNTAECVDPSEVAATGDSTTAASGDRASQIDPILEKVYDFDNFDFENW